MKCRSGFIARTGGSGGDGVAAGNSVLALIEARQVPWEGAPPVSTAPKVCLTVGSLP